MTEVISARKAFRAQPVMLVATANPKKPGSESHKRFEGYFSYPWPTEVEDDEGNKSTPITTVQNLLDAGEVRMDDIKHDSNHGFIVVGQEAIDALIKEREAARVKAIEDAKALLASIEK